MLKVCSKNEFERFKDFAYELACDLNRSGYPTYRDGIKTKEMFVERSLKAFERDTEEMLLFVSEGEAQGLIHYFWIPEDHYLETIGFNIGTATELALSEFLSYIRERYQGYDVYFGFPSENRSAVDYLAGLGFECIENDYNNTAFLDIIAPAADDSGMIRIGRDNFSCFTELHSQTEGDMYWNSERILDDLDNWVIFIKEEKGETQGAVYYRDVREGWFEIFGIDIKHGEHDPKLFRDLLRTALTDAKRRNERFMTFFCDEEYEDAAKESGFLCVGRYQCFKTHLE